MMNNRKVPFETPISSADLIKHYGIQSTYQNAARAAQRCVVRYNLRLSQTGSGLWVSVDDS
jgi:hypothetical protein